MQKISRKSSIISVEVFKLAGEKTEKKTSKNLSLKEIKEAIRQEEEASHRRKKRLELERTKKIDKVFFWLGEYVIQDASLLESFLKNKEYIARFTDADMALVKEVIETRQEEAAEKARKAEEKRTRLGAEEQKTVETNQTPENAKAPKVEEK
jgi:hypothetical protein